MPITHEVADDDGEDDDGEDDDDDDGDAQREHVEWNVKSLFFFQ